MWVENNFCYASMCFPLSDCRLIIDFLCRWRVGGTSTATCRCIASLYEEIELFIFSITIVVGLHETVDPNSWNLVDLIRKINGDDFPPFARSTRKSCGCYHITESEEHSASMKWYEILRNIFSRSSATERVVCACFVAAKATRMWQIFVFSWFRERCLATLKLCSRTSRRFTVPANWLKVTKVLSRDSDSTLLLSFLPAGHVLIDITEKSHFSGESSTLSREPSPPIQCVLITTATLLLLSLGIGNFFAVLSLRRQSVCRL